MLNSILYAIGVLMLVWLFADLLFSFRDVPGEPPRVKPGIPLLGHLFGLVRFGNVYFSKIG